MRLEQVGAGAEERPAPLRHRTKPLLVAVGITVLAPLPGFADEIAERAARLHRDALVIDTHIDTTGRLLRPDWSFFDRHPAPDPAARGRGAGNHVDYPRMREGGLDGAFFSIFVPGTVTGPQAVKRALEQIDAVRRLAEQNPDRISLVSSAAEARAAHAAGRIAAFMGMEGGQMLDDSLAMLRTCAALGVRYLTLAHSVNTTWADSSTDTPRHNGLTAFGKDVVRELNRLGVMVDVSHAADTTFADALEVSRAPLLASHSSCRAISGHPRNMSDAMIKALAAKGGVIQVNYLTAYLDEARYRAEEARQPKLDELRVELEKRLPGPENAEKRMLELRSAAAEMRPPLPSVGWEKIVEHIEHVAELVGPDHVGLGSDFDGAAMPVGMEDCSQLPKLTEALLRRGYSERQIRGILGENLLRLLERVEEVGRELRAGGAPGPAMSATARRR